MSSFVPHHSLLPSNIKIKCQYCYYGDTQQFACEIGYFQQTVGKWLRQYATCSGAPPFPFPTQSGLWTGPFLPCSNYTSRPIQGISNCMATNMQENSFNSSCFDPINRTHWYNCYPHQTDRWGFYPEKPDFSSYNLAIFYIVLCVLCCVATVLLNCFTVFLFAKSKLLKSSKTVVFGVHMAVIDLLVALICLTLYTVIVYQQHHYFYKGSNYVSESTIKTIDLWFNRFDLLLLLAAFTNLALMSIERCASISKPFWSMAYVTLKVIFISVPLVWTYTFVVFFIFTFGVNKVWFNFFAGFAIPTTIMSACYVIIIKEIKKSNKISSNVDGQEKKRKNEHKATINLLILVIVFVMCWLPYFIILLIQEQNSGSNRGSTYFVATFRWFKLLSYCHCFMDPILYALSKPTVKREVKKITLSGSTKISRFSKSSYKRSRIDTCDSYV